jgi:hypothetical protein
VVAIVFNLSRTRNKLLASSMARKTELTGANLFRKTK